MPRDNQNPPEDNQGEDQAPEPQEEPEESQEEPQEESQQDNNQSSQPEDDNDSPPAEEPEPREEQQPEESEQNQQNPEKNVIKMSPEAKQKTQDQWEKEKEELTGKVGIEKQKGKDKYGVQIEQTPQGDKKWTASYERDDTEGPTTGKGKVEIGSEGKKVQGEIKHDLGKGWKFKGGLDYQKKKKK